MRAGRKYFSEVLSCNERQTPVLLFLCCLLKGINCSALLTANIRTLQSAACETDELVMRCPPKTSIHIVFANYGRLVSSRERPCHTAVQSGQRSNASIFHSSYDIDEESRNCLTPSSKQKVMALCQDKNRSTCRIPVNGETFKEDPCPRTWKYLEVAYKCKPNVFHSQVVCEGETMKLECEKTTHRLAIQSAMFGRDRSGSAVCPDRTPKETRPPGFHSPECFSSFATEMAMTKCQNERSCTLFADEATFGDQCPAGTLKYLVVSYACVPQRILIKGSNRAVSPKEKEPVLHDDKSDEYDAGDHNSIGDPEDHNSIGGRSSTTHDIQAIEPDSSSGSISDRNYYGGNRKGFLVEEQDITRCNCTENISVIMDWIVVYQKITGNRTAVMIYSGAAAGVGLVILMAIIVGHYVSRHRSRKREREQNGKLSHSSSKQAALKEQRMPLYSTRFAEENEEADVPVDLTVATRSSYAPRNSLPRAVSLSIDGKKPMNSSRSMHRLTTDGSFYS
ncbi:hypothetical protein RvY_09783 [Ramazzottius varieornatus]|uniref:SUEL-type lectin domain-containing protein n=1 Tax=Ramazzottius varieornatus TaxID=947166 RepID=A0A1D1VFY4_RAMVA|nr:hypothetical protein RvY_09783 [Ramazzottius varieornatus]